MKRIFPKFGSKGPLFYGGAYLFSIVAYAVIFKIFPDWLHDSANRDPTSFMDALYFSTITITTLGYGDIYPITEFGKMLASSEAILGVSLLGLFLNSIAQKISRDINRVQLEIAQESKKQIRSQVYANIHKSIENGVRSLIRNWFPNGEKKYVYHEKWGLIATDLSDVYVDRDPDEIRVFLVKNIGEVISLRDYYTDHVEKLLSQLEDKTLAFSDKIDDEVLSNLIELVETCETALDSMSNIDFEKNANIGEASTLLSRSIWPLRLRLKDTQQLFLGLATKIENNEEHLRTFIQNLTEPVN